MDKTFMRVLADINARITLFRKNDMNAVEVDGREGQRLRTKTELFETVL